MNIKAFIFDMDGVMLDSEPFQLQSFNKVLGKYNIVLSMSEFKKTYMGFRDTQICEKMISTYNLTLSVEDFVNEKRSTYLSIIGKGVPPTDGLVEVVKKLFKILPLGIASSSSLKEIEIITQTFKIRNFFKEILSAHQVDHGKPAPDVYLKISEMMGVEPSLCGVNEDTKTGVKSAKAAGMKCVAITTTHSAEELSEADYVISSFNELFDVVSSL